MMQLFNASLDFNQHWIAYKNGFGDSELGQFWLGNEKVHLLTNTNGLVYRLRIEEHVSAGQANDCLITIFLNRDVICLHKLIKTVSLLLSNDTPLHSIKVLSKLFIADTAATKTYYMMGINKI